MQESLDNLAPAPRVPAGHKQFVFSCWSPPPSLNLRWTNYKTQKCDKQGLTTLPRPSCSSAPAGHSAGSLWLAGRLPPSKQKITNNKIQRSGFPGLLDLLDSPAQLFVCSYWSLPASLLRPVRFKPTSEADILFRVRIFPCSNMVPCNGSKNMCFYSDLMPGLILLICSSSFAL